MLPTLLCTPPWGTSEKLGMRHWCTCPTLAPPLLQGIISLSIPRPWVLETSWADHTHEAACTWSEKRSTAGAEPATTNGFILPSRSKVGEEESRSRSVTHPQEAAIWDPLPRLIITHGNYYPHVKTKKVEPSGCGPYSRPRGMAGTAAATAPLPMGQPFIRYPQSPGANWSKAGKGRRPKAVSHWAPRTFCTQG